MADVIHLGAHIGEATQRELLAAAPSPIHYVPVLMLNPNAPKVQDRCTHCCHWSLPLSPAFTHRKLPENAAMLYHEWLVWHLHVGVHQQFGLVA